MNKPLLAWIAQLNTLVASGTKQGIPAQEMIAQLDLAMINLQNTVPPAPALKEPKSNSGEQE